MRKTYMPRKEALKRNWYLIDAKDKILGRLAVRAASVLRGKHKPIFTPHMDTGDSVIIVNAAKIKVTGRKMKQKVYRRYSGYPGGLHEVLLEELLQKSPVTVVRLAVERMLPQNRLGRDLGRRLKVYADDKHDHGSQKPLPLEV